MSDFQAIADRVEIEAVRGEFTDAAIMRDRALSHRCSRPTGPADGRSEICLLAPAGPVSADAILVFD